VAVVALVDRRAADPCLEQVVVAQLAASGSGAEVDIVDDVLGMVVADEAGADAEQARADLGESAIEGHLVDGSAGRGLGHVTPCDGDHGTALTPLARGMLQGGVCGDWIWGPFAPHARNDHAGRLIGRWLPELQTASKLRGRSPQLGR
jgi:hypothetical protein